jgi:hypothetical protein
VANKTGLPGSAEPWGRDVEKRLHTLEHKADITSDVLDGMQSYVDKTVTASFETGQSVLNGVVGKVIPTTPVAVKYVSGTGLFEVTVTLAGLVSFGSVLGAGFESQEWPYDVYFEIPSNGPVATCALTENRWVPFAQSRSTIISSRPGVFDLSLYLYANTTQNASAQAFLNKVQLSVKAV